MHSKLSPKLTTTVTVPDGYGKCHDWFPSDFPSFLTELEHITEACAGDDPAPLFRGHANEAWRLDCTFVRNFIETIFSLEDYQKFDREKRRSIIFHQSVLSLFLLKFGVIFTPSLEALEMEKSAGIDPWFEFMKHSQQYPETDRGLKGTFLTDWTTSPDIAIYFANDRRIGAGAVWVCDLVETGKTLQVKKMGEILALMQEKNFSSTPAGVPLIFHPKLQALHPRAVAQLPVYIAQMDYRADLADAWITQEAELVDRQIFIKLILPNGSQSACHQYLAEKGITREVIYPI